MLLTAQRAAETAVPLKTWANPLFWQPNQAEREAAGKATPQLQFSSNAVSTDALTFVAITPCRLMDTRGGAFNGTGTFAPVQLAAAATLTINVQATTGQPTAPAPCGIVPSIAEAYSFNVTVIPHAGGAVDYVTLWPGDSDQPFVSTLDDPQGLILANAAIIAAGSPSGAINVYNAGPAATDVVIDMNGYYTAPSTGASNTAVGIGTLASITSGTNNTASGVQALASDTTGGQNTASGAEALTANTTGADNTADGHQALASNTTGGANTANGHQALSSNTTGGANTASGTFALASNTTGIQNIAVGFASLANNLVGGGNIGLGYQAGVNIVGSNNIDIGNSGVAADGTTDNGEIRIGTAQSNTYIAGIWNGTPNVTNMPVCVDANGILGTVGCGIDVDLLLGPQNPLSPGGEVADMGHTSDGLLQLRPVTLLSKPQYEGGSDSPRYGLIAAEVAKVYPEMVGYEKDGSPSTVKYQALTPMLLNEVQKQNAQIQRLESRLATLETLLPEQIPATERPVSGQ
jgi:hypothetical protein